MIFRKYFAQLILLPVLASPLLALAAPGYKVAFAPTDFTASKMNNRGQIVGTSGDQPAIWNGDGVSKIAALSAGGQGLGINNRGDIVGIAASLVPFVHTRAGVRYIRPEEPWTGYGEALAINDAGTAVGWAWGEFGTSTRGFLSSRRGTSLIDELYPRFPTSINSAGHVVGKAETYSSSVGTSERAFLYRNGALKDLGTLGGRNSIGEDINDAGQIVGYSDTVFLDQYDDAPGHAFLYRRGTMKDLGTLGGTNSYGYAINNAGVAVGYSQLPGDSASVAFIYVRGKMTDLNAQVRLPEGWTLTAALDVNDKGQILAHACSLEDCAYARLTPRRESRLTSRHDEVELDGSDDAGDEE